MYVQISLTKHIDIHHFLTSNYLILQKMESATQKLPLNDTLRKICQGGYQCFLWNWIHNPFPCSPIKAEIYSFDLLSTVFFCTINKKYWMVSCQLLKKKIIHSNKKWRLEKNIGFTISKKNKRQSCKKTYCILASRSWY